MVSSPFVFYCRCYNQCNNGSQKATVVVRCCKMQRYIGETLQAAGERDEKEREREKELLLTAMCCASANVSQFV